jgi:hypothetical protein
MDYMLIEKKKLYSSLLFVCCTAATRTITEIAQKHKENTNIRAETTARRAIKQQKEVTKIQASKTKHKRIL